MAKKIVLATGGTAGHVLPATVLAKEMEKSFSSVFMGVNLETNPYFHRDEYEYVSLDGANFSKGKFVGLWKILKGFFKARHELKKMEVAHVIGFGSYFSLPTLLAAFYLRIPVTLYEPNILPGKVNRILSRLAKRSFVHFRKTANQLNTPSSIVHFSLQPEEKLMSAEAARLHFGLDPDMTTFLVFGGSQGSKEVNRLFLDALKHIPEPFQVIHVSGGDAMVSKTYREKGVRAFVRPFIRDISKAWMAADLAVCRAGAGAMRGQLNYGVPAIMVPIRGVADNHQVVNAEFMESCVKGTLRFDGKESLSNMIKECFKEGGAKLNEMKDSLVSFKEKESRPRLFEEWKAYIDKEL